MLKALLWKEFREHRQLVVGAWAIATIVPLFIIIGVLVSAPGRDLSSVADMLPIIFVFMLWPVFAAVTGASTVGTEMADGSLRFLLSRPVSRARVWFTKVGAAMAAFVAIAIGTLVVSAAFSYLLTRNPDRVWGFAWDRPDMADVVAAMSVAVAYGLLFACSMYCSMFFRRPLSAALVGLLVAAAMAVSAGAVWAGLLLNNEGLGVVFFGAGVSAGVPLAAIGVFVAAYWVFCHGEVLDTASIRRMARPLLVVMLVVMTLGAVPATFMGLRSMASISLRLPQGFTVADGSLVLSELTPAALSTRLRYVDLRSGEAPILVPRLATAPVHSADGSLVAYVSFRSYLGVILGTVEVRVVGSDGSNDQVVIERAPLPWNWVYRGRNIISMSPDNIWVSLDDDETNIIVAPIAGGEPRSLDIDRSDWRNHVIGWTQSSPAELLYTVTINSRRPDERTELRAFDPASGAERRVAQIPGGHSPYPWWGGRTERQPVRGWSWYPVWLEDPDADRMYLINTESGERVVLTDSACPLWALTPDGRRFIYGRCTWADRPGEGRFEMRVRDLQTGDDELFAVMNGYNAGREFHLSPDGDRILFHVRRGGGRSSATWLVHRQTADVSDPRVVMPDFVAADVFPLGWLDDDHAVLVHDARGDIAIDVVNVTTKSTRRVYPRQ